MAILALTPYSQKYPQASTAVTKALDALRTTQAESGAFVDSYSGENSCSTAYAILALCAAGEDPTTWKSSSGKSALDGLLSYALTDLSGFGYTDNSNFDNYSTLEAFEALAAYHGFTNAQKAGENSFNLFTQPAKSLNENTEQTTTKKPESTTTNSQTTANENTNSNKQQNNSSSKHKKSAHKTDASNNPEEANDDTSENAAEENFEEAASQANEPSSNKEATSDEQTTGGIPTWLPIAGIALGAALLLGVGIYLLTSRRNNQDN
jgi:hypothetical protein